MNGAPLRWRLLSCTGGPEGSSGSKLRSTTCSPGSKAATLSARSPGETQVRGIERDEDHHCIDVLTQVGAVKTALESMAFEILDKHVTHCVQDSLAPGDAKTATERSEELLAAVKRFTKTRSR